MRKLKKFLAACIVAATATVGIGVTAASANPYGYQDDEGGAFAFYAPDRDSYLGQYIHSHCRYGMDVDNYNVVTSGFGIIDDQFSNMTTTDLCDSTTDVLVNNHDFSDESGIVGQAQCLSQLYGVCVSTLLKIDLWAVVGGVVDQLGYFDETVYNFEVQHLANHEYGHSLGLHHNDDTADPGCGPDGASESGDHSAMGPNWHSPNCTHGVSQYADQRLRYNLHEVLHTACWLNEGDLPGGSGPC